MNRDELVLEARDLSVDYGIGDGALHAVDHVDLLLRRGEVLGIAGESGCGKSTLAYAVTRLLHPPGLITGGEVYYHPKDGPPVDVLGLSTEELRQFRWDELAIVFQSAMNALNPVLRLHTQFDDVLSTHRPQMSRAERNARINELLRLVGISPDRARAYPHELSGGMRQRAMIAIALALEPEIVVMDEPTTALDVVMQRRILTEIIGLRDRFGFSVIFITHDLSLLVELADTVAVMYAGKIVEVSAATEIYRKPRHPYTYGLLNSFPLLHGARRELSGIPGSPPSLKAVPSGCPFHPRCPRAFETCPEKVPDLVASPIEGDDPEHLVACSLYSGEGTPPSSLDPEVTHAN
ncbi:MAG TPA: ABC transporter ATP-binding protein [Acidimicrobiales bacterium]|nr:ABC transporter ATP-binding protein [Acidimicrobiales bacterium]